MIFLEAEQAHEVGPRSFDFGISGYDTAALLRAGGRVIRVIMHMQKRVKIPDAETKRKQW